MEFKKLDKAQKYYEQVKKLDAEIIEIEKLAQLMADGGKVSFEISCEPVSNKKKEKVLDEDGSLIISSFQKRLSDDMRMYMYGGFGCSPTITVEKPKKNNIKAQVADTVGLQVLGVLLAEKNKERSSIIKRLNKIMG